MYKGRPLGRRDIVSVNTTDTDNGFLYQPREVRRMRKQQSHSAFRGHRDDNNLMLKSYVNSGHFHTLLRFRIDSGDLLLGKHFAEAPKKATCSSKTIQNELITQCGDHILSIIIIHDTKPGLYSIQADEVTDISNKEHMSLVIRFFAGFNIQESCVDFNEYENFDGVSIASKHIGQLKLYGLNLANLCLSFSIVGRIIKKYRFQHRIKIRPSCCF